MNVKKTEVQAPEKAPPPSITASSPLLGWRDDFDRLFDSMLMSPLSRRLGEWDPFHRRGMLGSDISPRMDVIERDNVFEVTAELPGVAEGDVDISISDGMITIRGEKKAESESKKGDYHLSERSWGSFTRSFHLPENADEDHIDATFEKGVLTLTMPKTEKPMPPRRKIEVKTTH